MEDDQPERLPTTSAPLGSVNHDPTPMSYEDVARQPHDSIPTPRPIPDAWAHDDNTINNTEYNNDDESEKSGEGEIVGNNATGDKHDGIKGPGMTSQPLGVIGLVSVVYFLVAGGAYGTEDLASSIPPLFALLGITAIPWLWSLPIALSVSEMASAMPTDAGFLLWTKRAFGQFASFIDGWMLVWVIIIDQTIYPRIFVDYMGAWVDLAWWEAWLICIAYIFVCLVLNLLGVANLGRASLLFSLFTLIPFGLYVLLGFISSDFDGSMWVETSNTDPDSNKWDIGLYMSVLVWATCGYEYSGFLAGNVRNPARTFPIGMIVVNILMLSTYLLPIAITVATADKLWEVTEGSYPHLANNLGYGDWFGVFMTLGGLVSTMGTYNAYLHTSSKALYALARDGMAPSILTWTPSFFTKYLRIPESVPVLCIFFFSTTTAVLVLVDFTALVQTASFLYCAHAVVLCFSFVTLRFREPNMERPYKFPFGWFGAVLGTALPVSIACVQMLFVFIDDWVYGVIGVCIILIGIGGYCARWAFQRLIAPRLLGVPAADLVGTNT